HTRFSRDWSSDVCSSDLSKNNTGSNSSWLMSCPISCSFSYVPSSNPLLRRWNGLLLLGRSSLRWRPSGVGQRSWDERSTTHRGRSEERRVGKGRVYGAEG